jgi:hypothetical protein
MPALTKFAVSLKTDLNKISSACSLSGHRGHKKSSEDENETEN